MGRVEDRNRAVPAVMFETLLDLLFPPTCLGCRRGGAWVCEACASRIWHFEHPRCPACGGKRGEKHECTNQWPFDSLLSLGSYGDPLWQQTLKRFKYGSATCLEGTIRSELKRFREQYADPWPWAGLNTLTVCPVPTDEKRKRSRGFDHTEALATIVRETLVPWAEQKSLLRRTRTAMANAKIDDDRLRQANVSGIFSATQEVDGPVLLVDDVLTSGATLAEAAKTLKHAGATGVHVFVLAKASVKRPSS